jgi:multimeric flavodoxin WrbA
MGEGSPPGRVGGAFASSATQHGGQETTLFTIITNLLHFGIDGGRTELRVRRPDES